MENEKKNWRYSKTHFLKLQSPLKLYSEKAESEQKKANTIKVFRGKLKLRLEKTKKNRERGNRERRAEQRRRKKEFNCVRRNEKKRGKKKTYKWENLVFVVAFGRGKEREEEIGEGDATSG